MLRDGITGLLGAGLVFAYFVLAMSLSPLEGRLAGEARDVLLIPGCGLAAIVFVHCLMAARDDRRRGEFQANMAEQDRLAREAAREKALRLNAYVPSPVGCETTGGNVASAPMAQIIPFPGRHKTAPIDCTPARSSLARCLPGRVFNPQEVCGNISN